MIIEIEKCQIKSLGSYLEPIFSYKNEENLIKALGLLERICPGL